MMTIDAILAHIRGLGWAVAVHNDYRQDAAAHTFWLFTHHDGRYAKGEGLTDVEALERVLKAIGGPAPVAPLAHRLAAFLADKRPLGWGDIAWSGDPDFFKLTVGRNDELARLVVRTMRSRGSWESITAADYMPFVNRILAGEDLGANDYPKED